MSSVIKQWQGKDDFHGNFVHVSMLKVSKVAYVCWLRCHENHSFLATVYLHLTWVNGGVEAEVSEVEDDADYTLMDTYQV